MPKSNTAQLGLDVQDTLAPVIKHRPYSQCNALGVYDKHVELLECLHGPHNWAVATITLAFTRQGYFWGVDVRIPSLSLQAGQKCSYGQLPVSTRLGAVCAAKSQIAKILQLWGAAHPLIKEAKEYQSVVAWLYQNDEVMS